MAKPIAAAQSKWLKGRANDVFERFFIMGTFFILTTLYGYPITGFYGCPRRVPDFVQVADNARYLGRSNQRCH